MVNNITVQKELQVTPFGQRWLQTDTRQDRWLHELEHASFQSTQKPGRLVDRPRQQALADNIHDPQDASATSVEQLAASAADHKTSSTIQADQASPAAEKPTTMDRRLATPANSAAPMDSMPGQKTAGFASHDLAAISAALVPRNAVPGAKTASAGTAIAFSVNSTVGSAFAPPSSEPTADNAATLTTDAPVSAGAMPTMGIAGAAKGMPGMSAEAVGDDTAGTVPPDFPLPDEAEYAARLLHIYLDADGVHAWLRDAELAPAQIQLVAQNIASEIGGTGARLAALTINGRRQFSAASDGVDAAGDHAPFDLLTDDDGAAVLPLNSPYPQGAA